MPSANSVIWMHVRDQLRGLDVLILSVNNICQFHVEQIQRCINIMRPQYYVLLDAYFDIDAKLLPGLLPYPTAGPLLSMNATVC